MSLASLESLERVFDAGGYLPGTIAPAQHPESQTQEMPGLADQVQNVQRGHTEGLSDKDFDAFAHIVGYRVAFVMELANEWEALRLAGTDSADLPQLRNGNH